MVSRLAETVRDLAPRLADRDAVDAERYPAENIADLVGAGVIRAPFPVAAGGSGCTLLEGIVGFPNFIETVQRATGAESDSRA